MKSQTTTAQASQLQPRDTRRRFLTSTGTAVAGLLLADQSATGADQGPPAAKETLAVHGGSKAVTHPHGHATRWPLYGEDEEREILKLLREPGYGPIDQLEADWKKHFQVPHARAYCSGTSALTTMFFALDLPPGSEVMVPSYTFFASIVPMRMFGLVPVFVDINPRTLNFDLEDAKRRLTKNTSALLPVHWIGLPCEMDRIGEFAREKGLIVLEDACQAHGASLQGKPVGSWGRMGAFSFQNTKPLPAIEGGMGVYQERADFERGSTLGHYDKPRGFPADSPYRKYYGTGLGLKFRMHPMAALLARCQLRGLDERNARAAAQIRRLNDRILHLPGLYEQAARPDMKRIYYAWNMLFLDEARAGMSRDACVKALQAEGVRAGGNGYPLQHKLALYAEAKWWHHAPTIPELPGSEQANRTSISLPVFTSEQPELVEQYVKAFEKVWAHRAKLGKT
ncbi:MAG: DegT/DnrJ/EryC1/StrS family aminotransferase [Verrucomicrobia bacterium]|nr:DegT/DnrJ/EryC1/StrS family aminotransferase [Verrucomicrobiota bacterium]